MVEHMWANGKCGTSGRGRRVAVDRSWHPTPIAARTVRHIFGSSTNTQSAVSERDASHRRSRSENRQSRRHGAGSGSWTEGSAPCGAQFHCGGEARHLGSLDRVTRVVRLGVSLATSGDIRDQPKVADAASQLFQDVFEKETPPCRVLYGVASLPFGSPVEPELILEVSD